MKIGILGTGRVGQALGKRWISAGRDVVFGTRQAMAARRRELQEALGTQVTTVTTQQCVAECDVLLMATPWPAGRDLVAQIPSDHRVIIIDCMNPLRPDLSALSVPAGESTAKMLSEAAPHAAVIKAFNCASSGTLADPNYENDVPTMLYCGDDEGAKQIVASLIEESGLEAIDVGDLSMAAHLESLALLTIKMAIKQGWGGDCALKILRRQPSQ